MQAVVKTPHTEIIIKGVLPNNILKMLEKEYGPAFHIIDDTALGVDAFTTEWYQAIKETMKPGDYLRAHRERMQLTQAELGQKVGGLQRQHISNMERGIRPISLKMAKAFAELFDTSFSVFLQ